VRRLEHALLQRDIQMVGDPTRAQWQSLVAGCVVAALAVAGCAVLAVARPQATLGSSRILIGQESGALYVRVADTLHPALNLASARLIAATDENPRRVSESELSRAKRGPVLGILGAPHAISEPLTATDSAWTVCDTGGAQSATVVIAGAVQEETGSRRLPPEQAVLVTSQSGGTTYLLYDGRRAVVDPTDPVAVRALRLENAEPRAVSPSLLNAVPEAPPIVAPSIPAAGSQRSGLPGFAVSTVVGVTRLDADQNSAEEYSAEEYYVVLGGGIQRVGQVAADLVRFADSQGNRQVRRITPDAIAAASSVNVLRVSTFPERAPRSLGTTEDRALCVNWKPGTSGSPQISVLTGSGLPIPAGEAPVGLAQADGTGPALDAVYLAPGRSAYVRSTGLTGYDNRTETRYLVTDTGVRFAIPDGETAGTLGLRTPAAPAPWQLLAGLPAGPELTKAGALVPHDGVAGDAAAAPPP